MKLPHLTERHVHAVAWLAIGVRLDLPGRFGRNLRRAGVARQDERGAHVATDKGKALARLAAKVGWKTARRCA